MLFPVFCFSFFDFSVFVFLFLVFLFLVYFINTACPGSPVSLESCSFSFRRQAVQYEAKT